MEGRPPNASAPCPARTPLGDHEGITSSAAEPYRSTIKPFPDGFTAGFLSSKSWPFLGWLCCTGIPSPSDHSLKLPAALRLSVALSGTRQRLSFALLGISLLQHY